MGSPHRPPEHCLCGLCLPARPLWHAHGGGGSTRARCRRRDHGRDNLVGRGVADLLHSQCRVGARRLAEREMFIASDPAALVAHTRSVVHLDDGEIALVRADGFETSTLEGGPTAKIPATITWTKDSFDKG